MKQTFGIGFGAWAIALLAGCAQAPQAPTAQVTPGPGKTDEAFQADMTACKKTASDSVAGQVSAANTQAVTGAMAGVATAALTGGVSAITSNMSGTATSAAQTGVQSSAGAQGTIQQQYDVTFNNCMFAAGDNVPGMAPATPPPEEAEARPAVVRDPVVMKVQTALIQLGYLHGGADGEAGPMTAAAIRKYETDKGLTVDGVASRHLLASLQDARSPDVAAASNGQPAVATSAGSWAIPPAPAPDGGAPASPAK
jgi:hypothetical protein